MKTFHDVALATLLATVASMAHAAGPVGYSAWDVSGNDKLVRMDLSTGVGTVIGTNLGFTDVDGLAFNARGELFGVDDNTNNLLKIDTNTGQATAVGSLQSPGSTSFNDMGLAFIGNTLYMSSTTFDGVGGLFTVNTSTGGATLIGNLSGLKSRSLGSYGGVLYGWSSNDELLKINTSNGSAIKVGSFGLYNSGQDGMDIDPLTGTIWSISENEHRTYTIDALTGVATIKATTLKCGGVLCGTSSNGGFNSLAIPVPEPEGYALALSGLGMLGLMRRRHPT
jgi:MYXO-CTERM domain-containing protein